MLCVCLGGGGGTHRPHMIVVSPRDLLGTAHKQFEQYSMSVAEWWHQETQSVGIRGLPALLLPFLVVPLPSTEERSSVLLHLSNCGGVVAWRCCGRMAAALCCACIQSCRCSQNAP